MNSVFCDFINIDYLRMITIKLTFDYEDENDDEDDWNKPAPRNP